MYIKMTRLFRHNAMRKAMFLLLTAVTLLGTMLPLAACGKKDDVPGAAFSLINNGLAAPIYVEGDNMIGSTTGDWPGVVRAAHDLRGDISAITGVAPVVVKSFPADAYTEFAFIIGTIGKSAAIRRMADAGKIDISGIEGKWESYLVQAVSDPFLDGKVGTALVVAGSDKRGSIFGIYSISELIGMSPWHFFADSAPIHRDNYVFPAGYRSVGDEPKVKYRGIFINDEEDLELWGRSIDEGKHLGPNLYKRVFELLLRIKANYIWPGMHQCSDAFTDYAENPVNADYYGLVIGTTHCDMLGRNNINEWDTFVANYRREHPEVGTIEYDYTVNPEIIREYWRISIERSKGYEMQWTLGMRGAHDESFTTRLINNAPWYGDRNMLLEQIIEDQRQMLREALDNPTLKDVFMMFIPYKEVQDLYNGGLNLPEDITIMWANDNHGFIRNLPNEEERARSGGHGVYYHYSYWGPANESYMWFSAMPVTLAYEELNKAIQYDAVKAWVVNVGDLIPNLPHIDFFMDYGYNPEQYTHENVMDAFYGKLARREFGAEFAPALSDIMKRFTQITNTRKIEQMSVDIFTPAYGDESEKRAADYKKLLADAEALYERLPAEKRDCYYESFLFKIRCAAYTNYEFYYAHKGNTAYREGRAATAYNCFNMSKEYNYMRKDEVSYYNNVLRDGKWKNLHDPENYVPPVMAGFAEGGAVFGLGETGAGVTLEGGGTALAFYNYAGGRKYFDIFNRGAGSFAYSVSATDGFVKLSSTGGIVSDERRIWVSVDFSKVSGPSKAAIVTVSAGEFSRAITVRAYKNEFTLGQKTYVEQDGYVSIEAEHYTNSEVKATASWQEISDLGRLSGGMVRAESLTLTSYSEQSFSSSAPYLEYDVYFTSTGTFELEVYRLPTLSSKGRVRLAVQVGGDTPQILEGENDYGTGNYAWDEGVFTQITKHRAEVKVAQAGLTKVRLYMIDPFITVDKLVIYTSEARRDSYFGPAESYNTTFNTAPDYAYEPFYESKYAVPEEYDAKRTYGSGYFVENGGKLSIETETAALGTPGAYITNGRWMPTVTNFGTAMRTENLNDDFHGRWETEAPTLNYEIVITSPGTYRFWVSINSPMPASSVYAVGVNGSYKFLQTTYGYAREEVYLWLQAGTQLSFPSAGKYTLNFYCSQDGVAVDRLYMSKTSETPGTFTFAQSARTPVWTGAVSDSATDANYRRQLLTALNAERNLMNIAAGTGMGTYQETHKRAYLSAVSNAYTLLNSTSALTQSGVNAAISALNGAKSALIGGKRMRENDTAYLVYENFDSNYAGSAPYGLKYDSITGTPEIGVYGKDYVNNYLLMQTIQHQAVTSGGFAGYSFGGAVTDTVTVETRMSFNEAERGYAVYLMNTDSENAFDINSAPVRVAFEFDGGKYNIVAYHGAAKRVIGNYGRNEWVDFKVVANVASGTFDVYLNGRIAAEDFAFRGVSSGLRSVTFGSTVRDAKLRVDYIKVY
jgi:hypothetical protein